MTKNSLYWKLKDKSNEADEGQLENKSDGH